VRRPVVWSYSARDDLIDIIRYIAERNPDAAGRVADRIEDAAAALAEFPTGRPGRVTGTYERVLADLPYIIAYEITERAEGGEMVVVLHAIHGARDWPPKRWPAD
jgi:plasmid stabilization system protein ParE